MELRMYEYDVLADEIRDPKIKMNLLAYRKSPAKTDRRISLMETAKLERQKGDGNSKNNSENREKRR